MSDEIKHNSENKTISLRIDKELNSYIEERLDEIKLLTKKDYSTSDYIRGLIQKDIN